MFARYKMLLESIARFERYMRENTEDKSNRDQALLLTYRVHSCNKWLIKNSDRNMFGYSRN